eukprot:TRINITY_DN662_c0_g1_i7.p3 TRINITY_DN662_c0_g1~~TRINITY_DN662_c0_g1_i7.p3  ORF type:complete len:123 (+),score=32.17 TRINITY_DN662_c0_g1_i7:310-678(+)
MAQPEQVGKAFVDHYYQLFDQNRRAELGALYQPQSMLSFENDKYQGSEKIVQKLTSLNFQQVRHEIVTFDAQQVPGGGIIVMVCGNLQVDGGANILKFSQVFTLFPNGAGWSVFNDLFRLNV